MKNEECRKENEEREREGEHSSPGGKPPAPRASSTSVLFPQELAASQPQPQKRQRSAVFVPPTVEEVAAYCKERKNGIDAEAFVAFYESKGWLVGKTKMKNWRQAVITWERRRKEQAQARASPVYQTWRAEDAPKISEEERAAVAEGLGQIFGSLKQKTVMGG